MPPKRKRSSVAVDDSRVSGIPQIITTGGPSDRRLKKARISTNPDVNDAVVDGADASRASPDNVPNPAVAPGLDSESSLSDVPDAVAEVPQKKRKPVRAPPKSKSVKTEDADEDVAVAAQAQKPNKKGNEDPDDPEAEGDEEANEEELKEALSRPPPVNSDYLPLPWKGRLGYACLNTYLRLSNPPVFSSRTCRIASILEHRHPLKDPSQPEHATKNRPDKDKPADVRRGQQWVEQLGLANARDISKMLRWNDRYGIKFMRLSSEMFPFASHDEYGYKLAPFAAETLAEAGKVVAELGHRVTTHPGQFTQLGSPRTEVVTAAVRDLEYHDEMLTLLKLPPQQDRDAVMILHMGGMFGSKEETLDRFRENYAKLPQSIKNRLVLENDDMGWSVHDILPVCEELNIPMVLDFHHHNIVFDATQIREGTKDIIDLFPRILATWKRKNITPKMHYSEQTAPAITPRQRRKHSARVMTLPPCPPDMDLMIEAKDKEQAVFELMRTFKLPGFERIHDVVPYVRNDDNKATLATLEKLRKKKPPKKVKDGEDPMAEAAMQVQQEEAKLVPEAELGMGGPEGRVYWPVGMEEWLRPKKREVKKKEPSNPVEKLAAKKAAKAAKKVKGDEDDDEDHDERDDLDNAKMAVTKAAKKVKREAVESINDNRTPDATKPPPKKRERKKVEPVLTPSTSDGNEDDDMDFDAEPVARASKASRTASGRKSGRASRVSYAEAAASDLD